MFVQKVHGSLVAFARLDDAGKTIFEQGQTKLTLIHVVLLETTSIRLGIAVPVLGIGFDVDQRQQNASYFRLCG